MSNMKKCIVVENAGKGGITVFFGEEETKIFFDIYLTASGLKDISYFPSLSKNDTEMIRDMVKLLNLSCSIYKNDSRKDKKTYWLFIGSAGITRLLSFLFDSDYLTFNNDIYDWVIGELCNIPNCCINKYINFADTHKMVEHYLHQLNGKKDMFGLKDGDRITSEILNYIPCSPQCKGSKIRYAKYKKIWKEMFDNFSVSTVELKKNGMTGEGMEWYSKKTGHQNVSH